MRGPIYCETGHPWLGIAEPVNFVTNIFAIIAAFFAMRMLMKSPQRRDAGLWLLVALLYAVGIGSALWHGLRTMWALTIDTLPGLLFLLVLVGLWVGRLYGRIAGALAPFALIATCFGAMVLAFVWTGTSIAPHSPMRVVAFFVPIILLAISLIVATWRRGHVAAARAGIFAIASALIAATARSVDMMVCPFTPFGSHFLWHFFLSLAAFLAIVTMMRLKTTPNPAP